MSYKQTAVELASSVDVIVTEGYTVALSFKNQMRIKLQQGI